MAVSELVTNAVRHAKPPHSLRFTVLGGMLLLEVTDGSPDLMPVDRGPGGDGLRVGELGLTVVAACAGPWKVRTYPANGADGVETKGVAVCVALESTR